MPKILTNLLIIGIIGAGITGAYFIIQNSAPVHPTTISKNLNNYLKGNNPVANNPLIARNSDDSSKSVFSETPGETFNSHLAGQIQPNLTQAMSRELAENLAKSNPNGPENIEGKKWLNVPDTEQLSEDLITKAAENFDPLAFRPVINDKDLKISSNNSKEALTKYFISYNEILIKSAQQIPKGISTDFENIFPEATNAITNAYQIGFDNLIKIQVPSSLLSIHKKKLELFGAGYNISKKIQNYAEDPVTAILASQELKKVFEEIIILDREIVTFIKQSGITI